MKAFKSDPHIERLSQVKQRAGLILALICLTGRLALPGYSQTPVTDLRWFLTGSLKTYRYGHTATLLPNGKVLVVGGGLPCSGSDCSSTVNIRAELYDAANMIWSYTGSLNNRRAGHSATLLQNGQVLVAGGHYLGSYDNSAELYDPVTGQWRLTGSFNTIQAYNSATLLRNGKVLAVGQSNLDSDHVIDSAELYDPATGKWSITAPPSIGVGRTTLLSSGKVLAVSRGSSELYDPETETWSGTGNLNVIRFAVLATLLQNGKVLVTGTDESGSIPNAELYDPETGTWSITGSPQQTGGTDTLLSDGRVLAAGGFDNSEYVSVPGAELYDPATGKWSITSHLNAARSGHTATLLPDGKVLVTGGVDTYFEFGFAYLDSAELYGQIAVPRIVSASVEGKRLFVVGENVDPGAVLLLNGVEQVTKNDPQNPHTVLIGKRAGKNLKPGDKLQVRNPNGTVSQEFTFTSG
jgi:Kelch motif protein